MTPIEQKMEQVAKATADFQKLNDAALTEAKKAGEASSEAKAAAEKASADITKIQDEVKAMHAAMNRSTQDNPAGDAELKARKDAFNKFLRKGDAHFTEQEQKALSVVSDPDGGFLVTPEMSSEIVKKIFESSPMRQLASVQTISSDTLEIIEDLDEAAADWVTEVGSRAESNTPQLKKLIIPVHEQFAKPKATQKILDDAMFNVESWLQEHVQNKFARLEATGFISGNGVGKPKGILSYTAGTGYNEIEQVVTGSAATITADGVLSLSYALKGAYKQGAAFMMKRATVAAVRKLKDSQNQYLWQPGLQAGQPDLLLGFPVYEADDMEALGANALVMAFGNFKAGYQIVDRFGIRTLRDPFSSKPYVEFYTTKRVGGGVKNFEAIKLAKCAV